MLEIKTLDKIPLGLLHKCIVEVMGNNPNASKMTPETVMRMNTMRGVEYRSSICAMDGGRMAAFILNSTGMWENKKTAYNVGTGVIPKYRGTQLSQELMIKVKELLKKHSFQAYMLDVLSSNEKAREVYRGIGFAETRNLMTMFLSGRPLSVVRQTIEVQEANKERWVEMRSIMLSDQSVMPSWLNSWDIFFRMPEVYTVCYATIFEEVAGIAVFTAASGEIHQLWVKSQLLNSGIGSALMAYIAEHSKASGNLIWHNIDTKASGLLSFLRGRGFEERGLKAEMSMPLYAN